jgi:hypothetical protein
MYPKVYYKRQVGLALRRPCRPSKRRQAVSGFSLLPVQAQQHGRLKRHLAQAWERVFLCEASGCFLIDALDLNWGARMSRVQVTGDLSSTEFYKARSDRGCAGPGESSATERHRELSIYQIAHTNRHLGSGMSSQRCVLVPRLLRSRSAQQAEMGILSVTQQHVEFAGSIPSADLFEELKIATPEDWSSSRLDALRFPVTVYRASKVKDRVATSTANED